MSRQRVGWFAHGCPVCGARYEALGVVVETRHGTPTVVAGESRPCLTCRTGRPLPWWPQAWLPRECCRAHARPVADGDERLFLHVERLAPDVPWFVCTACGRTFPLVNPAQERSDAA